MSLRSPSPTQTVLIPDPKQVLNPSSMPVTSTSTPSGANTAGASATKENNHTGPSPTRHKMGRKKSNSISNAVLARSRNKKVSFSNFQSYNSSQVFTSSNSSSSSNSANTSRNSSEEDLSNTHTAGSPAQQHIKSALFTTSVSPSPNTLTPSVSNNTNNANYSHLKKYSLKKLQSYPFSSQHMSESKSLDSQMFQSCSPDSEGHGSNSNLPEFNKRPLTDTPIVSSMGSPITREQSSEYDEDEDEEVDTDVDANQLDVDTLDADATIVAPNANTDTNVPASISKTKNISHLSLADLNISKKSSVKPAPRSESISPMTSNPQTNTTNTPPPSDEPIMIPAPSSIPETDGVKKLQIDSDVKQSLLQDVPVDLQQQFEKTPSLERLKTLLMTKPPPSARKAYTLNIPGQTSSKTSPDGRIALIDVGSKLVIVMVGLPARGKSYITNKLTRYLNWLQHDCRVFNVGNTRRKDKNNSGPEKNPLPDTNTPTNENTTPSPEVNATKSPTQPKIAVASDAPPEAVHNSDFFNPDNKESTTLREKWAMDTLDQLLDYVINGPGSVGIFDATNSTKHRRLRVLKRIQQRSNGELKVLFLESICNNPSIIESNIRLKLSGPDYRDMEPELALKDFVGRLHNYEKAYETIDEAEEALPGFQYVKMIDVGKKVVSYNVQGFLASQTVYFLLNFNLCERQIWITRHGESVDNLSGRIGGDSHLTKRGLQFSKALARFMNFKRQEFRKEQLESFSTRLELKYNSIFNEDDIANIDNIPTEPNFCVWTSMLTRAIETGKYFNDQLFSLKEMRMLNELGGGKFEGLTYDEIQREYPREFDSRLRNKLAYRYPGVGGESYLDVLTRLRPLISELERTTDHLLIISHRVVLRILLAYFLNLDKSSIGELDVPLHTLYCLELKPYGTDYRMYEYDEAIDWFVRVEPEHQKNMKEVGVVFKERKYSVVPTAPPSSSNSNSAKRYGSIRSRIASTAPIAQHTPRPTKQDGIDNNFSLRRSLSFGSKANAPPFGLATISGANEEISEGPSISSKKLEDLNKLRKP